MTAQFTLNASATAMHNADALLRAIAVDMAADPFSDKRFLPEIVEVRRSLQRCGDLARSMANDIKNSRVREMHATGATSLREIA